MKKHLWAFLSILGFSSAVLLVAFSVADRVSTQVLIPIVVVLLLGNTAFVAWLSARRRK